MPRIFALSLIAVLVLGCDTKNVIEPMHEWGALAAKGGPTDGTAFATLSKLPTLKGGGPAEAHAINQSGSIIAGHSWDSADLMQPVTWRLQNGNWSLTKLPFAATAPGAIARGVNDQGDVAGNFWPGTAPRIVIWPSGGGFNALGCDEHGEGNAISAGAQRVAGVVRHISPAIAAVWQPGSCREDLPPLVVGEGASAYAINGDGTIAGGHSGSPVRWRRVSGVWQVEQLDSRPGGVLGANSVGDLVGQVEVACTVPSTDPCSRGMIWYENGTSRDLGNLGGESTGPRGINAAGEVVGLSRLSNGDGVPFFWSEATGMRQLPVTRGGWALAVSGVRSDGTRLVVGVGSRPSSPLVWVVRVP